MSERSVSGNIVRMAVHRRGLCPFAESCVHRLDVDKVLCLCSSLLLQENERNSYRLADIQFRVLIHRWYLRE